VDSIIATFCWTEIFLKTLNSSVSFTYSSKTNYEPDCLKTDLSTKIINDLPKIGFFSIRNLE